MALTGSQQAYRWARSGIARAGATRSNYVAALVSIDWIVRDPAGGIVATTDISQWIRLGTLHITQAINDEPDTCSFTIVPEAQPGQIPQVGDEIRIAWAPGPAAGVTLFHGYVLVSQADWRLGDAARPWTAVQCQDAMWRFDARMVNYRFPAQSVTASIEFLVAWFCNGQPETPAALYFSTAFVQANMPAIPAFDVVNQRPSTVMRTLTAAVGGAFYLEGLTVHAWADSISEPLQTNPVPLTVGLSTLKAVRVTTDATQLRRRVLVEGRRTALMTSLPAAPISATTFLGVPLEDATLFDPALGVDYMHLVRVGTQWMFVKNPVIVTANGANPPQTQVAADWPVGQTQMALKAVPALPPVAGWIRVGNQYARYQGYTLNPIAGDWLINFVSTSFPYGLFTAPIKTGDTVEWVDAVLSVQPKGLVWGTPGVPQPGDVEMRAHPTGTPVVVLAYAQDRAASVFPGLEGFVQDGRYAYSGAAARAAVDLAAFHDPLVSVEWDTEDVNASPGRSQVVTLSSPHFTPAINTTVTVLRVELTFPLRTLPARRACVGGIVKPSTFLDLVVTTTN